MSARVEHERSGFGVERTVITWDVPLTGSLADGVQNHLEEFSESFVMESSLKAQLLEAIEERDDHEEYGDKLDKAIEAAVKELLELKDILEKTGDELTEDPNRRLAATVTIAGLTTKLEELANRLGEAGTTEVVKETPPPAAQPETAPAAPPSGRAG